jgi:hypothetical protein
VAKKDQQRNSHGETAAVNWPSGEKAGGKKASAKRHRPTEQHSTGDDESPQTAGEEDEADVREEDVGDAVNDVDNTDESGDEGTSTTADRERSNVPEHQARGPDRPRIVTAERKGRP